MYFYKLRFVLLFILLLSSCSIPGGDKRLKIIKEHNADQFIEKVYKTAYFEIYSLNKISNNKKVTVYIEGDGLSWIDNYTISSNPTPIDPLAFRLAKIDQSDNIIYLSRPCQYIQTDICKNNEIWTVSQYSEGVLSSYRAIIDSLSQFTEIHLVGYSGGAGVAMYLGSVNNKKIRSIRTIAGNINHDEFTQLRNFTPPKNSVNFYSIEKKVKNISQIHYFGKKDKTIPKELHLNFYARNKESSCIKIKAVNATHNDGWSNFWKTNYTKFPTCN
jgi:hypothetical protein|tara:strand:- start:4 stop:822 length:819 start_codon:yes stop_codon:yes gene_type:complete